MGSCCLFCGGRPRGRGRAARPPDSGAASLRSGGAGRGGGGGGGGGAKILQRLRRMLDPFLGVWSPRRVRQEGLQVLRGAVRIAALQQEKRQSVVRTGERAVELERAAVVADRLVEAARLGEGDRHVLKNARVVGMITQRQPIRRQCRVIIPLTLQG